MTPPWYGLPVSPRIPRGWWRTLAWVDHYYGDSNTHRAPWVWAKYNNMQTRGDNWSLDEWATIFWYRLTSGTAPFSDTFYGIPLPLASYPLTLDVQMKAASDYWGSHGFASTYDTSFYLCWVNDQAPNMQAFCQKNSEHGYINLSTGTAYPNTPGTIPRYPVLEKWYYINSFWVMNIAAFGSYTLGLEDMDLVWPQVTSYYRRGIWNFPWNGE